MSGRLQGRHAIVTGASSGVGAATARRFAHEGATVALFARRGDLLHDLAAEIGDRALAIRVDVSDARAVAQAVRDAQALGPVDVLVNSAAILDARPLRELDPEAWDRTIAVNLSGSFYVAREVALLMLDHGGGHIINIGSDQSFLGSPTYVSYGAAKAGILGLTRAMAAELGPSINVNVICPGPIETPMLDAEVRHRGDVQAVRTEIAQRLPLKRFATPEEVAAAVVYLASDGGYATGAALVLDGGSSIV